MYFIDKKNDCIIEVTYLIDKYQYLVFFGINFHIN